MSRPAHVFLSYVREDAEPVARLGDALESAGVEVWQDRASLSPGVLWSQAIVDAIRTGRSFVACFSPHAEARPQSGMRDELLVAIDVLRSRPTFQEWFVPVLLAPCEVPALSIGGNRTLRDIQQQPLYPDWDRSIRRLLQTLWRIDATRPEWPAGTDTLDSTLRIATLTDSDATVINVDDQTGQGGSRATTIVGDVVRFKGQIIGVRRGAPGKERDA